MKVRIYPRVLFRVPAFSLEETLSDKWEDLKAAIAKSSGDFYELIADTTQDQINTLPEPVQQTLWKYFNRAKYRATPYGAFAGVGICPIDPAPLQIFASQSLYVMTGWSEPIEDRQCQAQTIFRANTALYTVKNRIRYLRNRNGQFELTELEVDDQIKKILRAAEDGISFEDLSLIVKADFTKRTLQGLLANLQERQLIYSNKMPNLIGEDFFTRHSIPPGAQPPYIIATRAWQAGGLDPVTIRHLPELIEKLRRTIPVKKQTDLEAFKVAFKKKFDFREVPLMRALDPELGISYGSLDLNTQEPELVSELANRRSPSGEREDQKLLDHLAKFSGWSDENMAFSLEKFPDFTDNPQLLPNTFNVIASPFGEGLCIETAGGATATALLGRFSHAGQDFHELARELAQVEQDANPEVLFFDIAYSAEPQIDNVNRRRNIYNHQVNILNYGEGAGCIPISDIRIAMVKGELQLRSCSMNKRLIPRMASAYNFSRSQLSLFRLLADLQYQGLHNRLTFDLQEYFPGKQFYPRVTFKNLIVSRAKWILEKQSFDVDSLKQYLLTLGVPANFRTVNGDQRLQFDVHNDTDLKILAGMLKKLSLVIEESPLSAETPRVIDVHNKPYAVEFVIPLYHNESIFRPFIPDLPQRESDQSDFMPGQGWLYYEIFCHPCRANDLLQNKLARFVKRHHKMIRKWFFIRYFEAGHHIRFRMLLKEQSHQGIITLGLNELLQEDLQTGIISDVTLRTYHREMERYGHDIDGTESHFCVDSRFVLAMLRDSSDPFRYICLCHRLMNDIRQSRVLPDGMVDDLNHFSCNVFAEEHRLSGKEFSELNDNYKSYLQIHGDELNSYQEKLYSRFSLSFKNALTTCPPERQKQLYLNLIHMHCNRLFTEHQRTYELLVYYFWERAAKAEKSKAKQPANQIPAFA
ncbi:lantibiotic dehydratase [Taibaiella koreensis]|uniref:lantibiotic dehydratase n=1 Tax=Taibaiella koreensis TaxID=1268548 RepID=UPI000E5A0D52|nr:lantibiotic dehydratase [Taibaiella koreensis]